jgi:hypothetical protein
MERVPGQTRADDLAAVVDRRRLAERAAEFGAHAVAPREGTLEVPADHFVAVVDIGGESRAEIGERAVPPQERSAVPVAHHVAEVVDRGRHAVVTGAEVHHPPHRASVSGGRERQGGGQDDR